MTKITLLGNSRITITHTPNMSWSKGGGGREEGGGGREERGGRRGREEGKGEGKREKEEGKWRGGGRK